jgi:hypothetical protein
MTTFLLSFNEVQKGVKNSAKGVKILSRQVRGIYQGYIKIGIKSLIPSWNEAVMMYLVGGYLLGRL